jgi:CRISPR-associated protein Csx17
MSLHIHSLTGCSPTPLAHYLKALGILRLVAEQADSHARGWWKDEGFHVASRFDRGALLSFFLNDYSPTPLIAPWNGGSGFYPKDKTARENGVDPISKSKGQRLSAYREALSVGKVLASQRVESPKKEEKESLIQECRRKWRGPMLEWIEAALVLAGDGSPQYPAILGTGGNDGRLDFTSNFMQRIVELLDCAAPEIGPRPGSEELLVAALFGSPEAGLPSNSIGQFLPGTAGGSNMGAGFDGGSRVNPWDFVLMLEGAILFRSAVSRRASVKSLPRASAPFAFHPAAIGYPTAETEKNRGEQWMPLWNSPMSLVELGSLIRDGRCQLRRQPAQRPVEVARAIARLGVSRGISAFERYGYIERNGQANLATPLGRFTVQAQPRQDLMDQIAPWVDNLRRRSNDKNAPAGIARATRNCEEAMLACCRNGNDNSRWLQLLIALGEAEAQLCQSPAFTAKQRLQPLGAFNQKLSLEWLAAASDGSAEFRLAVAFAGLHGIRKVRTHMGWKREIDFFQPVRGHFMPLGNRGQFKVAQESLANDTDVVCKGHDVIRDAMHLIQRRILQARQGKADRLPLMPVGGTEASPADVLTFINGELDQKKIIVIARPLMALDWQAGRVSSEVRQRLELPSSQDDSRALGALALYGVFRLCHHWDDVLVPVRSTAPDRASIERRGDRTVPAEIRLQPNIFQRLAHGDLKTAISLAIRRLTVHGLRPNLTRAIDGSKSKDLARRIAAALAFPVSAEHTSRLAARLTRPSLGDETRDEELEIDMDD